MAFEIPLFKPAGLVAAADYSAKQFYAVAMDTTNKQVVLCSTDGEVVFGILQNKPESGQAAEVMLAGFSKIIAGETLVAGDLWGTDSSGKARKVEKTNTGADSGDSYHGHVIEGGAANEYVTVSIGVVTGIVESA